MAETYPSDATLNALSGSCDVLTGIMYPTIGESPYYTSFYKLANHINRMIMPINSLRVYKDGDLTFAMRAGVFSSGDGIEAVSAVAAQALSDNATNYIYLLADGTLAVNTAGFATGTAIIPLATIATGTASAGGISGSFTPDDIVDCRDRAMFRAAGAVSDQQLALTLNQFKRTGDFSDLPTAGDGTNLSLVAGVHGSAAPMIKSSAANNSAVTEKTRLLVAIGNGYVAGADITLQLRAKIGSAMNTAATIDAEVFCADGDGGAGADLCTTAAITLTTSWSDRDFVITPTNVVAGDILDIEITISLDDTAGGSANESAYIAQAKLITATRN